MLGIALVHSKPYAPQGRGKQERLNSYIRSSFIAEVEARGIASFAELNDLFMAWAEQVANGREHAETKQPPAKRFLDGFTPDIPSPAELSEAFRWSVTRRVTKTATVSLLANRYGVGPELVGRTVELRFDPEDLAKIEVYDNGVPAGVAVPFVIGRHVHPAVPQAAPDPARRPRGRLPGPGGGRPGRGLGRGLHLVQVSSRHGGLGPRRRGRPVMAGVDVWASHFGFARTPFTKSVPADKLFERAAHAEAVARANYCINQSALGVIVGDTGAGKTVAVPRRGGRLGQDEIYRHLPGQPLLGLPGPIRGHRHRFGGNAPVPQGRGHKPSRRPARGRGARALPPGDLDN